MVDVTVLRADYSQKHAKVEGRVAGVIKPRGEEPYKVCFDKRK